MDRIGRLDARTAAELDGRGEILAEARRRRNRHGSYATYRGVEVERHHVASGGSADGMHVDLDALAEVARKLEDIVESLERHQETADRLHVLSHKLRGGQGPVSDSMRALFIRRAGDDGGLAGVLRNYHRALTRVHEEVRDAERRYRNAEDEAVRAINAATRKLED